MIDPKTLVIGNVVTFGGTVNKTVVGTSSTGVTLDLDNAIIPYTDSLWQISATSAPPLPPLPPTLIGGNLTLAGGNYFFDASRSMAPGVLLTACQSAVTSLQAAGVTPQ